MKWLTAVLLIVAAVLAGLLFFRGQDTEPKYGTALDTPKPLPDVQLLNAEGQEQSLRDSDGKMRLVFYGYVRCPDVCPATMNVLSRAYSGLTPQQQEKMNIQMVSIDPEHDRPEVLREYLNLFNPEFIGLTGTTQDIDKAAQEMFVGISRPSVAQAGAPVDHSAHLAAAGGQDKAEGESSGDKGSEPGEGVAGQAAMLHGDQVSVVDKDGNFVRVYGNQAILSGELAEDLPALLATYGPK